jgi:hypothetical protein
VRFQIGDTHWERLIDRPGRFEKKAHFRKGGTYKGHCWIPPRLDGRHRQGRRNPDRRRHLRRRRPVSGAQGGGLGHVHQQLARTLPRRCAPSWSALAAPSARAWSSPSTWAAPAWKRPSNM